MNNESKYLLQCLDCNCNDCISFVRDIKRTEEQNLHSKGKVPQSGKVHYGQCTKFDKEVFEMANVCLLHTQKCFVHRKQL